MMMMMMMLLLLLLDSDSVELWDCLSGGEEEFRVDTIVTDCPHMAARFSSVGLSRMYSLENVDLSWSNQLLQYLQF